MATFHAMHGLKGLLRLLLLLNVSCLHLFFTFYLLFFVFICMIPLFIFLNCVLFFVFIDIFCLSLPASSSLYNCKGIILIFICILICTCPSSYSSSSRIPFSTCNSIML